MNIGFYKLYGCKQHNFTSYSNYSYLNPYYFIFKYILNIPIYYIDTYNNK